MADPDALRRHGEALRPLNDFRDYLAKAADQWQKAAAKPDECVTRALLAWAEADALGVASTTNEEAYERARFIFSISVIALKFADALDEDAIATTVEWLVRLAHQNIADFRRYHGPNEELYVWEGAMAAAAYAISGDTKLKDFAKRALEYGRRNIDNRGHFGPALERGRRSVIYSLSATDAMIFIEEFIDGCRSFKCLPMDIQKLISSTAEAIREPRVVEEITGTPQEPIEARYLSAVCAIGPEGAGKAACEPAPPSGAQFGGDPRLIPKQMPRRAE